MPPDVHAALHSATAAAAHLRTLLSDLANAVEHEDEAAIAQCARALVQSPSARDAVASDPVGRSPDPHEERGDGQ